MFYAYGYDKGSKVSRIAQWRQVEKTIGSAPQLLMDAPVLDEELQYLWNEYCEIVKGCDRITWESLDSYQRLTGINLTPWESSIMIELDRMRKRNG